MPYASENSYFLKKRNLNVKIAAINVAKQPPNSIINTPEPVKNGDAIFDIPDDKEECLHGVNGYDSASIVNQLGSPVAILNSAQLHARGISKNIPGLLLDSVISWVNRLPII